MAFNGYYIKNLTNGSKDNSFINMASLKVTPNQREEIVATRDDYTRELYRETADGMKTKIEFSTLSGIDLVDKASLQNLVMSGYTTDEERKQRKVHLEYWDDELNMYKQGWFYVPNIQYPIISFTEDNIYYDSISISLIEY